MLSNDEVDRHRKTIMHTIQTLNRGNDVTTILEVDVNVGLIYQIMIFYCRGNCKSCKRFLNPIKITKAEFENLRSAFLEKVVIGKDVFSKTTPAELENFKSYVKKTAPYDMVLDGLNIAYTTGKKNGPKNFALSVSL